MWIIGAWLELPVWQQLLALAGCYAANGICIHLLAFHSPAGVAAQSGAPAVPAHQWPPDNTSDLSLTTYL